MSTWDSSEIGTTRMFSAMNAVVAVHGRIWFPCPIKMAKMKWIHALLAKIMSKLFSIFCRWTLPLLDFQCRLHELRVNMATRCGQFLRIGFKKVWIYILCWVHLLLRVVIPLIMDQRFLLWQLVRQAWWRCWLQSWHFKTHSFYETDGSFWVPILWKKSCVSVRI